MKENIEQIIKESIDFELKVAELYTIFYTFFEQDSEFWWKLVVEEKKHAALLESAKGLFLSGNAFPEEIIVPSLGSVIQENKKISSLINNFIAQNPSRESAFNTALTIELEASEIQYQIAMKKSKGSAILQAIQRINKDGEDHIQRIISYMDSNSIKLNNNNNRSLVRDYNEKMKHD